MLVLVKSHSHILIFSYFFSKKGYFLTFLGRLEGREEEGGKRKVFSFSFFSRNFWGGEFQTELVGIGNGGGGVWGVGVGVGNGWGVCGGFWGVVGRVVHCVGVGVFLSVGVVRGRGGRIWRDILTCTAVMAWAWLWYGVTAWARCGGA